MPDVQDGPPMAQTRSGVGVVTEQRKDHAVAGGDSSSSGNPEWGYGRQVLRRPEARGSEVAKANVIHTPEESRGLSRILAASVRRRRALSDVRRQQQLDELAELEAQERRATSG